jgi:hypothetical protein
MQKNSEYVELSLEGKWGTLARKWLSKNAPCAVDDYLVSVSKLMPTHIVKHDGRLSQATLARHALKRMKATIIDGVIQPLKPFSGQKGYAARVRSDALKNGYILMKDYPDIKNISGIVSGLTKIGFLSYESRNRYILNSNIEQEKQ